MPIFQDTVLLKALVGQHSAFLRGLKPMMAAEPRPLSQRALGAGGVAQNADNSREGKNIG